MPASGLLADLAIMMSTSPEDVATKGLELLLGRSPAASAAMNRLLVEWRGGQAGIPVSRWASQVVAADTSRTDLEGFSDTGATVAILENKFWAGLTDNQPAGYLQRLKESSGVLAFVVPDSRVRIMAHELSLRLEALHRTPCDEHSIGDTVLLRNTNQPTVVVTGWSAVLGALGSAMESAAEYANHADLKQLQGLRSRSTTISSFVCTALGIGAATTMHRCCSARLSAAEQKSMKRIRDLSLLGIPDGNHLMTRFGEHATQ